MSDREKLIELIHDAWCCCDETDCDCCEYYQSERTATMCIVPFITDYLISNGVTVQKWIPVSERLPTENGNYLCMVLFSAVGEHKEYKRKILFFEDGTWLENAKSFRIEKPLHWMPLPEPPKECE